MIIRNPTWYLPGNSTSCFIRLSSHPRGSVRLGYHFSSDQRQFVGRLHQGAGVLRVVVSEPSLTSGNLSVEARTWTGQSWLKILTAPSSVTSILAQPHD